MMSLCILDTERGLFAVELDQHELYLSSEATFETRLMIKELRIPIHVIIGL